MSFARRVCVLGAHSRLENGRRRRLVAGPADCRRTSVTSKPGVFRRQRMKFNTRYAGKKCAEKEKNVFLFSSEARLRHGTHHTYTVRARGAAAADIDPSCSRHPTYPPDRPPPPVPTITFHARPPMRTYLPRVYGTTHDIIVAYAAAAGGRGPGAPI